jgi:hypothetical protein
MRECDALLTMEELSREGITTVCAAQHAKTLRWVAWWLTAGAPGFGDPERDSPHWKSVTEAAYELRLMALSSHRDR